MTGMNPPFFSIRIFNADGTPAAGGSIEFCAPGSAQHKNVYANKSLTTVGANPVLLDTGGKPEYQFFLMAGEYDIYIRDVDGNLIDDPKRISGTGGNGFPEPTGPGYLHWDGSVFSWQEIEMPKGFPFAVWTILDQNAPETAPFGLSNDDINRMIDTGYGAASQMIQSTFQSSLSIWYATGTYWGDVQWEEKEVVRGTGIVNLNKGEFDHLHTHPESRPTTEASNYPAGIYSAVMVGDGLYWNSLVVEQYPDPTYNVSSFLKYDQTTKTFVWLDASALRAIPMGPAGGDLFGSYPDPRVKELTGTPAMLTPSIAGFDWKQSGGWASGAGIGFGFGYVNGVKSRVWMAISQLGELQISYDEWKTTVYVDPSNAYYDDFMKPDMTLQPFNNLNAMQHYEVNGSYVTGGIRFASITYASLPGSTDKYWIISGEYQLFAIKDIPTNYNTNGSLKLENVFQLVITNGALDPNTVTSNSDIMVITGNMSNIYYAEVADFDLVSATKTVTFVQATITSAHGTGVFGSNAYNGSEYLTIGRDTGIILTSATGKTWTVKTATSFLFQDDTAMIPSSTGEYAGALPMYTTNPFNPSWASNHNGWGGLTFADGLWIVVNAKPAPSLISQYWSPFLFSEDGVKWSAYKPTQAELDVNYGYSMYKIGFGYGKFFATNSNPNQVNTTQPAIYRLLMNEIPAHRKLVAEKGIDVIGNIRLLDLPNASSLATDAEGNIIAGSGGGTGNYIRNQDENGTNDLPGKVYLGPAGQVGIAESAESTYPVTLMDGLGFTVQNDVVDVKIDLSGMEVHDRIEENGQHAVYGRYSANKLNFTSYLGALSSVTEDIFHFNGYDYNGLNNDYRAYQFNARLKLRVGPTDTVPAELQHKFVDSDGNEFPLVDNGSYGKALKLTATGEGGLSGGFFPTMDIASTTDRVIPYLNGTRSELLVLAAPRVGYKITQGVTTQFGVAILQGGTGDIILTLRDINMNLIAESYTLTNPTSNVLQQIACGAIFDPSTGISISDYQLTVGTPYYIGINYSVNGAAYWGVVASETTNIQPVPAIRFDNLTNVPATLVVGNGSESLMRPYIRLRG